MSRLSHADPEGWAEHTERMLDAADLRRKERKEGGGERGAVRWDAEKRTYVVDCREREGRR